jgi:molybdate transport system substrate-binding protein
MKSQAVEICEQNSCGLGDRATMAAIRKPRLPVTGDLRPKGRLMDMLKVLGAGPVKRGVTLLAEKFEKETGARFSIEFAGAPNVRERVLAGEAVDVAIVPQATMTEFLAQGKVEAATATPVGRSRMGVAVRKGSLIPGLAEVEAFKKALLNADEIVCNVASSGVYMIKLLDQIGIGDAVKNKVLKLPNTVKVMEHVAGSPARAIGAGQLAEISELIDQGVGIVLAAPLPDAIQNVTAYTAAVTAASGAKSGAARFLAFLATPDAKRVFASTGID